MESFSDLLDIRQRLSELEQAISSGSGDVDVLLKQYSQLQDEYHDRNGYACDHGQAHPGRTALTLRSTICGWGC